MAISAETATGSVLLKKLFFRIKKKLTEKHLCWSNILIKLQTFQPTALLKGDSSTMFSSKFCGFFKNIFLQSTYG